MWTKVCARRGDQAQPNGRRRVERVPRGVCSVKEPCTAEGREMDQKQLAMSSLVKWRGGPRRGVRRDSSWGREKEGSLGKAGERRELKSRKSQISRAFVAVLCVRKAGEP